MIVKNKPCFFLSIMGYYQVLEMIQSSLGLPPPSYYQVFSLARMFHAHKVQGIKTTVYSAIVIISLLVTVRSTKSTSCPG